MKRDDSQAPGTPTTDRTGTSASGQRGVAAMIGASISINGDIHGEEDIVIEGEVSGTVQLKKNSLTIGQQGRVKADLDVHTINIQGSMEGDLRASDRASITQTAHFKGNVITPRLRIDDGAQFNGSIDMEAPEAKSATTPSRKSPAEPTTSGTESGHTSETSGSLGSGSSTSADSGTDGHRG